MRASRLDPTDRPGHRATLRTAFVLALSLMVALFGVVGCDSGNPVVPAPPQVSPVPSGVVLTVTLSISPTLLEAGSGIPGTVTITTRQTSDGQPPSDGTLVTVITDLGSLDSAGSTTATVGMSGGVASVSLFPADAVGTATVLAQVGDHIGELQVSFVESTSLPMFITSVQPSSGSPSGGTQVRIVGGGFVAPLQVDFGGAAASVVRSSAGQITVTTPPSATAVPAGTSITVDVTVRAALNTSSPLTASLPGGFVYSSSGGGVFISEVTPNLGSAAGGESVSILGSGFQEPLSVSFGGVAGQSPVRVSATEITVTVPPPAAAVPVGGSLPVDVSVTSGLDQPIPETATLVGGYVYSDSSSSVFITAVSPNSGGPDGGETVSINGGGFVDPVQVTFAGVSGITPAVISANEIQVEVPPPASTVSAGQSLPVDVVVTSGLNQPTPGTATLASGYTYVGNTAIQVVSISPVEGTHQGGTSVTAIGSGFPTSSAAVELAGVRQFNVSVTSETQLTFSTPALSLSACPENGRAPQVGVTVIDEASGSSGTGAALTFTYLVPLPRIDRVAPSFGQQLGNTQVGIEGDGFSDPLRVDFVVGATAFSATVQSSTTTLVTVSSPRLPDSAFPETDCVVDGNAGKRYLQTTADIRVRDPDSGCEDTFSNAFTYDPSDSSCRQTSGSDG